jgi:hypothetical protein
MRFEEGSPEHIAALLETVTEKVPKMITGVIKSLYSAEAGTNMGQAVGNLYKELVNSGIPSEEALEMAKDYMLSITKIMSKFDVDKGKENNESKEV